LQCHLTIEHRLLLSQAAKDLHPSPIFQEPSRQRTFHQIGRSDKIQNIKTATELPHTRQRSLFPHLHQYQQPPHQVSAILHSQVLPSSRLTIPIDPPSQLQCDHHFPISLLRAIALPAPPQIIYRLIPCFGADQCLLPLYINGTQTRFLEVRKHPHANQCLPLILRSRQT
jgi:hypothetical protein